MSNQNQKRKRKFTFPPILIMKGFLNLMFIFFIIFVFYSIKLLLGLGEDVTFSLDGIFTLMLASFGLFINLILAYIFFFKLLLNKKNLTKTRQAVTILISILILNIIINELGVYILNSVFDISLLLINIIMFLLIFYINKTVKTRLLKKES
jgi:hypothetical protein